MMEGLVEMRAVFFLNTEGRRCVLLLGSLWNQGILTCTGFFSALMTILCSSGDGMNHSAGDGGGRASAVRHTRHMWGFNGRGFPQMKNLIGVEFPVCSYIWLFGCTFKERRSRPGPGTDPGCMPGVVVEHCLKACSFQVPFAFQIQ